MNGGRRAGWLGILAAVFTFHLLPAPKVAVDALYHLGHAVRPRDNSGEGDRTTVDTSSTPARDFHARFVLVEPRRNPRLSRYLLGDPHHELALEPRHEAVFRLLDPPGTP